MKNIQKTIKYWLCFTTCMLLSPHVLGSYIWEGNGGGNSWTNKHNWKNPKSPSAKVKDSLIFGSGDLGDRIVENINKQYKNIEGISFNDALGGYTLNGQGRLVIDAGYAIEGNSGYTHTFNVDLQFNGSAGIIFNSSDNFVLNGMILGSGLTKSGPGNLTLYGDLGYSGTTTLSQGTLSGVFTIDDLNHTGGTLAPGNSIGTVTIDNGSYTLGTGAIYEVEVENAPGGLNNDLVNVTAGSATLENESIINVLDISTDGYIIKPSDKFSIIRTTDGVTDNGAFITDNSAVLAFTGVVSQNEYVLTALRDSSFADVVKGLNSNSTMSAIDSETSNATGDFATIIGQLQMLNTAQLQDASKELSPINHTPASTVSAVSAQKTAGGIANYLGTRRLGVERAMIADLRNTDSGLLIADVANNPDILASAIKRSQRNEKARQQKMDSEIRGFIRPFSVSYQQKATDEMIGFTSKAVGVQFGLDRSKGQNLIGGLGGSYGHSFIDFDEDRSKGDVDSFRIGPYATCYKDDRYIDSSVTFGYHSIKNERGIKFGAVDRVAKSEYDAFDLSVYFGGGFDVPLKDWKMTPNASIQYIYYYSEAFKETNAGSAGLNVDERTTHSVRSRLGVNLSRIFDLDDRKIASEMFCGWAHEFIDDDGITARFVDGTAKFTNNIDNDRQNSVYFGAGLSTLLKDNISAFARYEGDFSESNSTHSLNFGITILF